MFARVLCGGLILFLMAMFAPCRALAQTGNLRVQGDLRATGYIIADRNFSTSSVLIGPLGSRNAIGLANSLAGSAYNFSSGVGDPNLYLNRPAGNSILFRENDANQVTIAPGGNVGIGISTPQSLLSLAQGGALQIGNNTDSYYTMMDSNSMVFKRPNSISYIRQEGVGGDLYFTTSNISSHDTNAMMIQAGGNVGIGTTTPSNKLEVNGNAFLGGKLTVSSTAPQLKLQYAPDPGYNCTIDHNGTWNMNGITYSIFQFGGVEKFRFTNGGSFCAAGSIGVGTTAPGRALEMQGVLRLDDITTPSQPPASFGTELFSYSGSTDPQTSDPQLFIWDATGDKTRLNSHASPLRVTPDAQCSFNDPSVELPFSFSHENTYIGKGQIVDMAKLVAWAEKKMKAEQGDQAGRLIYTYDLPPQERTTLEQYAKAQRDHQANRILDKLNKMSWIKVEVGADGSIPLEAFEDIPESQTVVRKVKVVKKEIDFTTKKLVSVEQYENEQVQEPTGRITSRLRENWKLENGELYRKPTINDVNIDELVKAVPHLPQRVLDRIKAGQQANMSVQELSAAIRQILAEKAAASAPAQAASMNR